MFGRIADLYSALRKRNSYPLPGSAALPGRRPTLLVFTCPLQPSDVKTQLRIVEYLMQSWGNEIQVQEELPCQS